MAKLIKNNLSFKSDRLNYIIDNIKSGILILDGDSGIGKTRYFDIKRSEQLVNHKNDIIFIDYHTNQDMIKELLKEQNKIIFIDNADIILFKIKDLKKLIKESNSQFIIFGRKVNNYDYDLKNWATIDEIKHNTFKLDYYIDEQKGIFV